MRTEPNFEVPAESFQVQTWVHWLGGLVGRSRGLWQRLGNLETGLLAESLAEVQVREPVYVTGLARSGSTLLLEILSRHPDLAAHSYRDYPLLFTPYLWNRYLDRTPQDNSSRERTHGDGIFITPESPEAFEEVLWMAFFPGLHDPGRSSVLEAEARNPDFEKFYSDHIRKLLLVRGRKRYLTKGNYNITRLSYIRKIFGDARFVIPVREPIWHIASLIRQHRLFCRGQENNPRALAHMQRIGHFEFGLDRRPINTGDDERVALILELWEKGDEVRGCAVYWALIHDFLARELTARPELQSAVHLVRYEDFCRSPQEGINALLDHCRLTADDPLRADLIGMVNPPVVTKPKIFSDRDIEIIEDLTAASAHRLGLGRYHSDI